MKAMLVLHLKGTQDIQIQWLKVIIILTILTWTLCKVMTNLTPIGISSSSWTIITEITCMSEETRQSKKTMITMMDSETTTYLGMKETMWMKMLTSSKTIMLTQSSNSRKKELTILMISLLPGQRMRRRARMITILIIERVRRLVQK